MIERKEKYRDRLTREQRKLQNEELDAL